MLLVINAMRISRPREWVMAAAKGFRLEFRSGEMLVTADDPVSD